MGIHNTKSTQLAGGRKPLSLSVDVSSMDEVVEAVAEIERSAAETAGIEPGSAEAPHISGLVHCAGITRDAMFRSLEEEAFDDVIAVNLKGTFNANQAVARSVLERQRTDALSSVVGGGLAFDSAAGRFVENEGETNRQCSLVNISSISAKGNIGQANYAASKAGVIGMTKTVAMELARKSIRCNAILPGFVETPMTQKMPRKVIQSFEKQIPMGRFGRPEEIANMAAFLVSPLSSYMTGNALEVSGGFKI